MKMLEAVVAKIEVSIFAAGAHAALTAFEALTAHEAVPNRLPVKEPVKEPVLSVGANDALIALEAEVANQPDTA